MEHHWENNVSPAGNMKKCGLSYDKFDLPCEIVHKDLLVSAEQHEKSVLYRREDATGKAEKIIMADIGQLQFNPVEPVHKPKEITPFFLIHFEQGVTVKPKGTSTVSVTFPVEIACLFVQHHDYTVVDIFSMVEQKYTLYGSPKNGLICRYWKSKIYPASLPSPDPLREGIMKITLANTTTRWAEVTQAVFSANEMKIYYNNSMVYTESYMKILSDTVAETGFSITYQDNQLEKSVELLTSRKMIMSGTQKLMEEGY